jgi:NAD(P)-dependent dehydrogenase (short-subunit alcohol dehydrogenase family)
MTKELAGKIAFVTGSGRGLGRVMADRLAELGADVAIHDLTWTGPAKYGEAADLDALAKVIARHGGRVAAVSGNIGDKAAVAKMKDEIEAKLGRVDILVNCAGGDIGAAGGKPDPNDALGIPLEDIRALTENNLYGTILVCQAFVPPMVTAGSGSVINIGSAAAQFGVTNGVIYAALKAAVIHYTRCLAASVRTEGVRINAVSPGATKTARFGGDARRRSAKNGFVDQVPDPLWRAGRDRRRGRLPRGAEKQVYERSGSAGGRRGNAVSGLTNGREQEQES